MNDDCLLKDLPKLVKDATGQHYPFWRQRGGCIEWGIKNGLTGEIDWFHLYQACVPVTDFVLRWIKMGGLTEHDSN